MKLINRDKFLGDMFDLYIENRWSPRDIHFSLLDVRGNIDSPEYEVKAIPIEWIKNVWLKESENQEKLGFSPSALFEAVVNWMIEDWEKENEESSNRD